MSLKSFYKYRGNANDFGPTGDNGVLGGASSPTNIIGRFDGISAYSLVGGNGNVSGNRQRIEFAEANYAYQFDDAFTFLFWFKCSKSDANIHAIFGNYDYDSVAIIKLEVDASEKIVVQIVDAASNFRFCITDDASFNDGEWHMVTGIYDGAQTLTLNIDAGVFVTSNDASSGTLSGNLFGVNNKVAIGAFWDQSEGNWIRDLTGVHGLFAHFDHALNDTELRNMYKQTRQTFS